MKPGDIISRKRFPKTRAIVLRWASGESCPASDECDLSPFEVKWQVVDLYWTLTKVGDRDLICLHDIELVKEAS